MWWSCWGTISGLACAAAAAPIFMHVARPGYLPTEGCIALRRDHLLRLLERLTPGSVVEVLPARRGQ